MSKFSFFHFLKQFDNFEVPISFRHKKQDTYATWIGGFFTLALVISALAFGIVYFIPFVKKKNYSLYYYTMNLNKTESINFKKSRATLAYGFQCPENDTKYNIYEIEDFIETEVKYNYYYEGSKAQPIPILVHNCNDLDFYNDKNLIESIDQETFNKLKCFDDLDKVVKNRYQDRYYNFTYYQINIKLKNNIDPVLANNFLIKKDCKIELYYRDVKNDPEDFDEPIKPFIYEIFLQLNPDFESRMNVYFMNSYFENNNDLLFETKGNEKQNTIFSRTEQYYLHKTENTIGKIYIRADTRKMIIKRVYQTLLDFFAVTFSFWEILFIICNFILNFYNKFCLNYSISKKLFYLEGKDHAHFNVSKNTEKLKKLIDKTNSISEKHILKMIEDPNTVIRVKIQNNNIPTMNSFDNMRLSGPIPDNNNNDNEEIKSNPTLNRLVLIPIKFLDFLNVFGFKCCKCRKLETKMALFSNAEDIINSKLDIVYYLKSIFLLDIIKKITLDDKKEMLNFLCMPFVSSKNEENWSYYHYHENFTDKEFMLLCNEINTCMENYQLKEEEQKIITLVNHRLKGYIKCNRKI